MNKSLLTRALAVAAVMGVAGIAQAADTFDSPQQAGEASTMTNGQPNAVTNNIGWPGGPLPAPVVIGTSPMYDTTVLGGPPSTTTEIVTVYPSSVYVQPSTNWGYYESHPMTYHHSLGSASATSPVPDRAGELSNIVNGVPNAMP